MGCLFVLVAMLSPRFAIVCIWAFTNRMAIAFDSGLIAVMGFVFLPWTTMFYALAYAPLIGISGFGWFLVAIGFLMDLGSLFSSSRYRS